LSVNVAQSTQAVKGLDEILPMAQLEHPPLAPLVEVLPAAQLLQTVALVGVLPAGQFSQLPLDEIWPAAQDVPLEAEQASP
jgi:hypothetical protein